MDISTLVSGEYRISFWGWGGGGTNPIGAPTSDAGTF